MNENILISFIVPVYNEEKNIYRCLDSICKQTYSNIEVVVVDDGSIDNTFEIIKKYEASDNRIKCYYKENNGVSAARNYALQRIKGQYVFFVDADDWIEPEMAENNLHIMKVKNVDLVINDFYYNKASSVLVSETFPMNMGYINQKIIRQALIASDNMNSQCISLYSTKIIHENKIFFPENIKCGEDNIFNLIYADYIKNAFYTKNEFYHYEIHEGSGCRRLHFDQLEMYEKHFLKKIHYGNKWNIWDDSIKITLQQLIGTHFAAFSLMAQKEKKYNVYKYWMENLYNLTSFKYLEENHQKLILSEVPRIYKLLVRMIVKRSKLLSYLYCMCVNLILEKS